MRVRVQGLSDAAVAIPRANLLCYFSLAQFDGTLEIVCMKLKVTVIGLALLAYGNYLTLTGGWNVAGILLIAVGAVLVVARFSFGD
jgi:hypothetical protein